MFADLFAALDKALAVLNEKKAARDNASAAYQRAVDTARAALDAASADYDDAVVAAQDLRAQLLSALGDVVPPTPAGVVVR